MSLMQSFKYKIGLQKDGLTKRKTVTFGDTSAVGKGRIWSIISVITLSLAWYLGSALELVNPIFWPSPSAVWDQFINISQNGYRNFTLWEHIWASLYRIFVGFALGCLIGIPLGFAMGLSEILRGWFDPIVEFFRPIPPLAFIPLVIIWSGIGERSKILLLFFAALWIMVIAARAGVGSVKLSKIHAAYSLGANKRQILKNVILPNALPEIFTGMRVAMGICWGTVVAAELVAAESGVGFMIMAASKFLATDIVVLGVIIVGIIGYSMDILMRKLESKLIPWKGKS
ncbi:ABC transporter permease subunit [Amphritea sp. 2_MG-2023]|uniref:ABC transporter permease n=1 Tax=Amphritea TaxID=515417 RepID=UPI001C074909|nr:MULTISPECIES: ABC transporter permease subunit [Amphritea]MBU2965098.1 ABC transporter permease subunit [Amphritea atlantica]MDO6418883.1 ABC transporter permease subunit [Amphritea sp. 2_MG-2023]MDX2423636.1 ABC transporter permease subunit [Amphritea sp.]